MTSLVAFMNGASGRGLRLLLGIGLIVFGMAVLGGGTGAAVAVIGLLPIGLGLWGHCLLEPLLPRAHVAR